jgi:hypothetical protein
VFDSYNEEKIEKGKTPYYAMTVNYSAKGESKQKKIMSFANPAVYNTIKTLKGGETIDVEFAKDDKYYGWATVQVISDSVPSNASASPDISPRRVGGSYETAEERARKQVYIIRQSCLAQAVARGNSVGTSDDTILNIAQKFVDWVMHEDRPDIFQDVPNDL